MEIHGQIDKIEIIRSAKRSKTIGAQLKDNILSIYAPENIPEANPCRTCERFSHDITNFLFQDLSFSAAVPSLLAGLELRFFQRIGINVKYHYYLNTTTVNAKYLSFHWFSSVKTAESIPLYELDQSALMYTITIYF